MFKNKKLLLFISLATVTLVTMSVFAYLRFFRTPNTQTQDNTGSINFTEATDQEKSETDLNKEKVIADTETQNNQSQTNVNNNQGTSIKNVTPIITYIGQSGPGSELQANGYIPGILEKEGTCTLVLSRNGSSVKDSRTSIDNVQDTSCGLLRIPISKLSNGNWIAILSYKSAKSSGTSDKVNVEIK